MKLGIMQPYFFPYIGYFHLINETDRWIVFDVVQYNNKTWMNRNRILHQDSGWQYINIPVKKPVNGTPIYNIFLKDKKSALEKILGQIHHYKKNAPFFKQVREIIAQTFSYDSSRLVDINIFGLEAVCNYIDINFNYSICSEMNLDLNAIEHPGQWALEISSQLGADEYINPIGGKSIFREQEWDASSIKLNFLNSPGISYECGPYEFIENLSIIDVLMWNSPETVRKTFL